MPLKEVKQLTLQFSFLLPPASCTSAFLDLEATHSRLP